MSTNPDECWDILAEPKTTNLVAARRTPNQRGGGAVLQGPQRSPDRRAATIARGRSSVNKNKKLHEQPAAREPRLRPESDRPDA